MCKKPKLPNVFGADFRPFVIAAVEINGEHRSATPGIHDRIRDALGVNAKILGDTVKLGHHIVDRARFIPVERDWPPECQIEPWVALEMEPFLVERHVGAIVSRNPARSFPTAR